MSHQASIVPSSEVSSFRPPLTEEAFQAALQRGHGRAVLHALDHETYPAQLIHALTHNLRYDSQCEDATQDWYLLISNLSASNLFTLDRVHQIASNYLNSQSDDLDAFYLADTLAACHNQGCPDSLDLLYKFASTCHKGFFDTIPGAEHIIKISGEQGLKHVIRTLAQHTPLDDIDESIVYYYHQDFEEKATKESTINYLNNLTKTDSSVKPLLDALVTSCQKQVAKVSSKSKSDWDPKSASIGDVIDQVRNAPESSYAAWVRRWALYTTPESLNELIDELLIEENPHRIRMYLRAFTERSPLARYDDRLGSFLQHDLSQLRWVTYRALSTCQDERIHELALNHLSAEQLAEGSIRLFQSTYRPKDHESIESALYIPDNHDDLHTIGFSLLDVFEQNNTPECLGSMLWLYEYGPCMNCRCNAVKIMHRHGIVPQWVQEECKYDADGSIRELITGSEELIV